MLGLKLGIPNKAELRKKYEECRAEYRVLSTTLQNIDSKAMALFTNPKTTANQVMELQQNMVRTHKALRGIVALLAEYERRLK